MLKLFCSIDISNCFSDSQSFLYSAIGLFFWMLWCPTSANSAVFDVFNLHIWIFSYCCNHCLDFIFFVSLHIKYSCCICVCALFVSTNPTAGRSRWPAVLSLVLLEVSVCLKRTSPPCCHLPTCTFLGHVLDQSENSVLSLCSFSQSTCQRLAFYDHKYTESGCLGICSQPWIS